MKNYQFDFENLENTLKVLIDAVEQTGDNVMVTDKEGNVKYINPAFERNTGFSLAEVINKNPRFLKSGKQDKEYYEELWKSILSGKVFRATTINKKKSGELYYSDQTVSPVTNEVGEITHFVSVWKDITERMEYQNELNALNDMLSYEKLKLEQILSFDEKISALENINEMIDFILKKVSVILGSQRCSLFLVDENTHEICIKGAIGISEDIVKKIKVKQGEGVMGIVIQSGEFLLVEDIDLDKRIDRENNSRYKFKSFMCVPIKLENKLIGIVNVSEKSSQKDAIYTSLDLKILLAIVREAAVAIENARMYKELKYLTVTDPLTQLYNFRYFTKSLEHEINRFKRTARPLSLLMIDVDHFKAYNDSFGHLEGDILLKKLASVFVGVSRDIDFVCRYAGDEFAVILSETNVDEAKQVAQRMLEKVRKLKLKQKVTLSIGIAQCTESMDRRDFISKADRALFEAKHEGRDRVCTL